MSARILVTNDETHVAQAIERGPAAGPQPARAWVARTGGCAVGGMAISLVLHALAWVGFFTHLGTTNNPDQRLMEQWGWSAGQPGP